MADKKGGMIHPNTFNETTGGSGPEDFDDSGGGVYHSYDEVLSAHLSQDSASLLESPNVRDGYGIMGGPASGEPNPYGFSPTSEGSGKK
jgi:hypothetical protein